MWGVRKLTSYMEKRLPADHVVLKHLPAFLAHANNCAEINWPAASDNVGVIGYRIWLNGFEVGTTTQTKARLHWFNDDSGQHVVQIRAVDAAGNQSRSSPTLVVKRPSPEPTETPTPEPSESPTPSDESSERRHANDQSSESASGTPTDEKSASEEED